MQAGRTEEENVNQQQRLAVVARMMWQMKATGSMEAQKLLVDL